MSLKKFIKELVDGNYKVSFGDIVHELLDEKSHIKFFENLEDKEIIFLLKNIILKRFSPNEVIFTQGENKDDYIYYILDGQVGILIKEKNNFLKKIAVLKATTLLGEMKPILNNGRTATCIAGMNGAIAIGFEINNDNNLHPSTYEKFYRNMTLILKEKLNKIDQSFDINTSMPQGSKDSKSYYKDLAYHLAKLIEENNNNNFR
ncbi:MAG: cyclic nucleotide-binding domain-containing protein [Campylobacterota bacterium]|nr:cyclic nucleotide-binding domain-containing protein [Campylobacterota bacterium]